MSGGSSPQHHSTASNSIHLPEDHTASEAPAPTNSTDLPGTGGPSLLLPLQPSPESSSARMDVGDPIQLGFETATLHLPCQADHTARRSPARKLSQANITHCSCSMSLTSTRDLLVS